MLPCIVKLSECYIGKKFEKLTIKKIVKEDKYWVCYCDCDCGTKNKRVLMTNIKEGHTTSCGCNKAIKTPQWDIEDIKKSIYEIYGDEFKVLDKQYVNARTPMSFKHRICGEITQSSFDNFKNKNNSHCRFCLGLIIKKGVNDLWTLRPDIGMLLQDKNVGYKYGINSQIKTYFICPSCKAVNYKTIATVTRNGLCCDSCNDNISYPNKFIYHLLMSLNENFEREKRFDWCKNKPFDIYIENKKIIIEMDGGIGHGNRSFGKNWRNPTYGNDFYKDEKAKEMGIKVIRIDCDYPEGQRFEYIKNSILKSEISKIYNLSNINWMDIDIKAQKNLFLQTINDLNYGMYICDVAKKYDISTTTVGRYLKRGKELGLYKKTYKKKYIHNHDKPVNMFDKSKNQIKRFKNITDAANYIGLSVSAISNCCNGKTKTSGGYIWEFD